mgnify:CR=1 FL=1
MSYKVQVGNAILQGQVTASVGFSGSTVLADEFYGDGSNISNISTTKVKTTTVSTGTRYVPLVESATGESSEDLEVDNVFTVDVATGVVQFVGSAPGLTLGSAAMVESDLEKIDDITNGTVTLSKAVVVDANKDIGTFGQLSASLASASYAYIDQLNLVSMQKNWTNAGITVADLGSITTVDINGGTLGGITIDGNWTAAGETCADLGAVTTCDINGGTIGGVTIDGNWTAASQTCADLGAVTTCDINGGTLGGFTVDGSWTAAGTTCANIGTVGYLTASTAIALGGGVKYSGLSVETGDFTIDADYNIIVINANYVTGTLPGSPANGDWYTIKRSAQQSDTYGQTVMVTGSAAKTIDGEDSIKLRSSGDSITIVYDSTQAMWNII